MRRLWGAVAAGIMVLASSAAAQEGGAQRIAVAVTYRSSSAVYLDGGRNRSLAPGDTGAVERRGGTAVRLVITAVSSSSSAARPVSVGDSVAVGDTVVFLKVVGDTVAPAGRGPSVAAPAPGSAGTMHGRVALQYAGVGEVGKGTDAGRSSLLLALSLSQLAGSPFRLTMYGRVSKNVVRSGSSGPVDEPWNVRIFDMTLSMEDPTAWYGVALGRVTSRFVGGLGIVDGAQLFARSGAFTAGFLGGFQPDYRTSTVDTDRPKGALFVNYTWDVSAFRPSSTTLAYGRQLYRGALDREFAYLQNVFSLNSLLFLYQSSEFDLRSRTDSMVTKTVRLTNTFLSMTYQPESWVSISLGYDASRPPEFLESYGSVADSLIDREIKQGFRGNFSFRLPYRVTLGVLGGYRPKTEMGRAGFNAGGSLRVSDILQGGFSVGGRFMRVQGVYTEGNDASVDLEQLLGATVRVSLSVDRYSYRLTGDTKNSVITTASAHLSWLVSRGFYLTVTGDRVWESARDLSRVFLETGYHF